MLVVVIHVKENDGVEGEKRAGESREDGERDVGMQMVIYTTQTTKQG
jgi:hypothetical protein